MAMPERGSGRSRAWGTVVSVVLSIAVAAPIVLPVTADDFPVSTYPMFSRRIDAEVSVARVVATLADGSVVAVPPAALGTREVIQAHETVRTAIRGGTEMVRALCERVAGSVVGREPDAVSIAVMTDTFDAVAYFDGRPDPVRSLEHATCPVPGPDPPRSDPDEGRPG